MKFPTTNAPRPKKRSRRVSQSAKPQGSALVITIMIIGALMIVALGMSQFVPRDYHDALDFESSLTAENAAWSGVEQALYKLKYSGSGNTSFYELSNDYETGVKQGQHPFGMLPSGGGTQQVDCVSSRISCPAIDRFLGLPELQTPKQLGQAILNTGDTGYGLVVWHLRQDVGTPDSSSLFDNLDASYWPTRITTNINPIIDRDEVRRLDVSDVANKGGDIKLVWQPMYQQGSCDVGNPNLRFYMIVGFLGQDNNYIAARKLLPDESGQMARNETNSQTFNVPNGAVAMSLRFMVTGNGSGQEQLISGCFARYAMNSFGSKVDLGRDVITSIGTAGHVQRKVQVQVDRENGHLASLFDFGIACEDCTNIQ